ncbi:mitochondrial outer membrane protein porin of 34 kDa-like [Lycium ferocissimum]|uniref:mitochondrial outer membrane protein porin of 34 kDa-like n=1 Tax=Lycium ferocissimum TaxID=112874 RepID=UPI0028167FBC|nr:mitochondrial outer membrane protein porin of 34 kDa-like [Lycium ferocissimum]
MRFLASVTVDEAAPGLKAILSFKTPDLSSAKLEVEYLHDYAGISTSLGLLTAKPIVDFSGVVGTNLVSLGTDLSFDTNAGAITKCNAGFSFKNTDLIASLNL